MNKEKVITLFFIAFCGIGIATTLYLGNFLIQTDTPYSITRPLAEQENVQAPEQPQKTFNASTYELENGLQIVVIENHRAPVVTHMVWYRVGAADEPRGKSGIAHFLEHLMFKGHSHPELGTLQAGEFSKTIRALGGEDNAFTSNDYTAYFQSISKDHLSTVMSMEAARMRGLNLAEQDVLSERNVILEERKQRTDNNPHAQLMEQIDHVLFPNHPYGIPIIGWNHEIAALTQKDAYVFYNKYYAPNNAILIVSGDVTPDEVFTLAQETYGLLKPVKTPKRSFTVSPPLVGHPEITLEHPLVQQSSVLRLYRAPSYRQNKQEALALQILQEIMSGGSASRLYQSLVAKDKIASNVGLYYSGSNWSDSTISLQATPIERGDIPQIKMALDTELRKVIRDGVTQNELQDAVAGLQADAIFARDSVAGPAMIFGHGLMSGASIEDIEYWSSDLNSVTTQDIQTVAEKYLNPDAPYIHRPVFATLLPQTKMRAPNALPDKTPEDIEKTGE